MTIMKVGYDDISHNVMEIIPNQSVLKSFLEGLESVRWNKEISSMPKPAINNVR